MARSSKSFKRSSKTQLGGAKKRSGKKHSSKKSKSKKRSGSKNNSKSKKRSGSKKSKMAADMCRCMKCKKGIKPVDAQKKTLPNGRCALTGKCGVCGTKVFKFCAC